MNCHQCQDLLNEHFDGASPGDRAALDAHIAQCVDCRTLHLAAGRLEEGLRLFTLSAPPAHFLDAVVGQVMADQRSRRFRRRWVGVALAASLLLAVGVVLGGESPWLQSAREIVGLSRPKPPEPAPAPEVVRETPPEKAPSPIDLVAKSGSAMTGLPRRVAGEAPVMNWTLPKDMLSQLPDVTTETPEADLEKATQSLTEARQGAALAWEAVESPMRRATRAWSRLTPSFQKQ